MKGNKLIPVLTLSLQGLRNPACIFHEQLFSGMELIEMVSSIPSRMMETRYGENTLRPTPISYIIHCSQ